MLVGMEVAQVAARAAGENFPVGSILFPRGLRPHIRALYCYARLVDELGDAYEGDRLAALDELESQVVQTFEGEPSWPVLRNVQATVREFDLPREPFLRLIEADDGAHRLLAATIQSRTGALSGPLYVHAKIGIVDDAWLTIGSANLNEHSLFNDTEVNVVLRDESFVRAARLRLWSEHLERPAAELGGDPCRVVDDLWHVLAEERSEERKLRKLSHVSRRSRALLGPLNGLLVDG